MQQCQLCEQLLQNFFLVFYRARCMWLSKEWIHLSPERIQDTAIVLKRGKFCEDCPGKARSSWEDTGLNQSAERGTGQTWSKSDVKSWDLIINWMQLFSAVEVLGEIASRTKLTISLIVSLSPFLQCRSLSQADLGSFFLMEPSVNLCLLSPNIQPRTQISANGYSTINSLLQLHKTENGRGITFAENWS